ncbi:MAG TPA: glycosyltransferase family 2 protein [Solirubrobacterales bacterium]|nr:glycosyltransferase family 2 protein [Solirubrobacterales bacterium]
MGTPKWPFEGLALPWEILFSVCLVVVAAMFLWSLLLFVRAHAALVKPPPLPPGGADAFSWVFLVPALNEEVTIADSVQRLLSIPLARRRVVVIDDGSEDRTPQILAAIDDPDLFVLRREKPNAQQGKAAALNYAYRSLSGYTDRAGTIVVIVDADGRLHGSAPAFAASHFADPRVGGMQSLVRIYNRGNLLTWLQDVEFSVYGHLFQAGRDHWGTAGMGGNGQFNRLSALDDLADAEGPWRDRLTEDQDLGLRLLAAGWQGRQDLRATVDQQGLSHLRPLFRQRTRWSQGNLQAIGLRRQVARAPVGRGARLEQLAYLLMPFWQGIIGLGLLAALVLAVTGQAPFWGAGPTWQLGFFYLLAFGGTALGCIAARSGQGPLGWLKGFLIAQVYTPYTWFLWPVLLRATARQISSREGWAKTEREPLGSEGEAGEEPLSGVLAAGRS